MTDQQKTTEGVNVAFHICPLNGTSRGSGECPAPQFESQLNRAAVRGIFWVGGKWIMQHSGHKVLVDPDTTKKGVPTSYAIRNSENRYWRGPTRRSSEWTPAIALAYKFKAVNEAVAVATSVGAAAIVELRGNTVEEIRRIGK
jgi:hypothetical protein